MNLEKETETPEYKKTTGEMKEAMVSISTILNKHGIGTLYFGVKPSGDVIGQDVSKSSLRDVSRAVYESIRPQIYPAVEEIVLDQKHLIKVEFSGENAPYSAAGRLPNGRYTCPVVLKRFGLVCDDHLTNAGEVLFESTHPVPLKAGIFATDEKLTFLDMQLFEDNIYNLLNIAEKYILKNIRWRSEITGTEMVVLAILKQKPDSSRAEMRIRFLKL